MDPKSSNLLCLKYLSFLEISLSSHDTYHHEFPVTQTVSEILIRKGQMLEIWLEFALVCPVGSDIGSAGLKTSPMRGTKKFWDSDYLWSAYRERSSNFLAPMRNNSGVKYGWLQVSRRFLDVNHCGTCSSKRGHIQCDSGARLARFSDTKPGGISSLLKLFSSLLHLKISWVGDPSPPHNTTHKYVRQFWTSSALLYTVLEVIAFFKDFTQSWLLSFRSSLKYFYQCSLHRLSSHTYISYTHNIDSRQRLCYTLSIVATLSLLAVIAFF